MFGGKIKGISIGERMDFPWPNFGTWAISHFKQLVFHEGKPCQAQKRRYLLSLLKLPGSAVLVISYKWIYNQSYTGPPYPNLWIPMG